MYTQCIQKIQCIITYLYVLRVLPLSNTHHPQKLINIISRITYHPSKYHQHIVNTQHLHNLVGLFFCGGHGLAY